MKLARQGGGSPEQFESWQRLVYRKERMLNDTVEACTRLALEPNLLGKNVRAPTRQLCLNCLERCLTLLTTVQPKASNTCLCYRNRLLWMLSLVLRQSSMHDILSKECQRNVLINLQWAI
jgi:hypothetical protein